jgi:hypothetical protein
LLRADFDWVCTFGSIWRAGPSDIAELNGAVVRLVLDDFPDCAGAATAARVSS